jgi:hypothetical protein
VSAAKLVIGRQGRIAGLKAIFKWLQQKPSHTERLLSGIEFGCLEIRFGSTAPFHLPLFH